MTEEIRNYKETLHLPETSFPMKAGLAKNEPETLTQWNKINLYEQLRQQSKDRKKFILHDGPPYANGDIHIGHALNKIIKDIIIRSQQMMGKNAIYVPGWDCHGLPIEWKIEEKYRAKGQNKDDVPSAEFRTQCRQFANEWINIQSEQFQRLGIIGDWKNPYKTMNYESEAIIVQEFLKFSQNKSLYRGSKPIMWSVIEKTALAEAEIEYEEHVSTTIFVKFPIKNTMANLEGAKLVIWTTTPWTIPANRAIAYAPSLSYGLYDTGQEKLVLCDNLAERVMETAKIETYTRLSDIDLSKIKFCTHPLHGQGYDYEIPVLAADFVTDETGTGLVHIAPGHGQDDFELGLEHNIEIPFMIDESGTYYDHVPLFSGLCIFNDKGKEGTANSAVIEALDTAGQLLAKGKLRHQYPHSWRSKAPLIFRNTPQWFISMEQNNLRKKALEAIDNVQWFPKTGRNRLQSMVKSRPDWVVSRQRAWGVPLTLFIHKDTQNILDDQEVNQRIINAISQEGADAWFQKLPQEFLGDKYKAEDYEQITDILDVWFDSGVTHAFVLEKREDLQAPADLYVEGTDQHRGWFQSSLLTSCGTRGVAPYKAVITHGFTMDEQGRKMSKSKKNVTDPLKIIQQSGADIIRLWVMSSDYVDDQRIGNDIIKANTDAYRKIRNTYRFLLGNLSNESLDNPVNYEDMPSLERYMLHKIATIDILVRKYYNQYEFRKIYQLLFNFFTLDLSAFYFDIRKDTLYCTRKTDSERRSCITVLDKLFYCLTSWMSPILCFTMEEVWQSRFNDPSNSVHLQQFPDIPTQWHDEELSQTWEIICNTRRVVTGALEIERREKRIGSSLEAAPKLYVTSELKELLDLSAQKDSIKMEDICITSTIEIIVAPPPENAFKLDDVPNVGVVVTLAKGKKCQRSYRVLEDVGTNQNYPDLSFRDSEIVTEYDNRKNQENV